MTPSFNKSSSLTDMGDDYDGLDASYEFEAGDSHETEAADPAASELEAEGYEEGDAYDDSLGDEVEAAEDEADADLDAAAAVEATLAEDDAIEPLDAEADRAGSAWSAYESELADALDADGTDEFLGALLGGLSRVASRVARSAGPAARGAARLGGVARSAGQIAGGARRLADAGAVLARMLGQRDSARRLRRIGAVAQGAGRIAGGLGGALGTLGGVPAQLRSISRISGRAARNANPIAELLAQIGRLSADGADDFEAFDTMADLYDEGVDAALPAAVGVAARLAARALGNRHLARMEPGVRRAFVRAVAQAARQLVNGAGGEGVRALPRLAVAGARAARAQTSTPAQVPVRMGRAMTRAAATAVRRPEAMRRLAQPLTLRPSGIGRGTPTISRGSQRRYVFQGPVELTVRPL